MDESLINPGWMPVDAVVVDGRPGLTWMNMSGVELKEPFFQQTVDRVREEEPWRDANLFTEFDALLRLDQELARVQPAGFIFHSSRCGSTLVANACRALDDAIVLSEANAIDKLVARFITDAGDPVKESLYSVLLRAAVNALAHRDNAGDPRLPRIFVKFSPCGISQLERIRRIWPDVPWLFLYRDPVATIVSNMTTVPAWLLDEDRRILAHITGTTPAAVSEMSLEELCARSIGSFYSTAHSLANHDSMLLNYRQISLTNILDFFNVSPSAEELERIASGSRIYSKEASGAREFVPDADAKHKSASDRVRQFAEEFAMGPYNLLEHGESHEYN